MLILLGWLDCKVRIDCGVRLCSVFSGKVMCFSLKVSVSDNFFSVVGVLLFVVFFFVDEFVVVL